MWLYAAFLCILIGFLAGYCAPRGLSGPLFDAARLYWASRASSIKDRVLLLSERKLFRLYLHYSGLEFNKFRSDLV